MSSKAPPSKRRKLNPKEEEAEYFEEKEKDHGFESLRKSKLVKKCDVPDEICEIIRLFSVGNIIKCLFCEKEEHVDKLATDDDDDDDYFTDDDDDEETWDENGYGPGGWRYDMEDDSYDCECENCAEEHTCTLCDEYGGEDVYLCEGCGERVCLECNGGEHDMHHAEYQIDFTQDMIQESFEREEDYQRGGGDAVWG